MASISLELVIPASTFKASAAPVQKTVPIGPCKIVGAYFQFPSGCQYLVKFQLAINAPGNPAELIVPSSAGGDALDYIAFDSASGLFLPIDYIVTSPVILYANGWNEDTANSHWIKVLITLGR